jgi:hypothetical protein
MPFLKSTERQQLFGKQQTSLKKVLKRLQDTVFDEIGNWSLFITSI